MRGHKREHIESKGYRFAGISEPEMPGYGRMRRALIELDLAHGSLSAFRVETGAWEFFITPDAQPGFKDVALLPT